MNFEEWKKQQRKEKAITISNPFFGREKELTELKTFLEDKNAQIFGLCGVPMIGKTALVNEFLKSVINYEIQIVKFQNPEKPEITLDKDLFSDQAKIDWQTMTPKLIVIENFEEALQWQSDKEHLHEIKSERIREFLKYVEQTPFVKLILVSRFQIKIDFLSRNLYTQLKNKQLGGIDRAELFRKLNQIYRNNAVTYETFELLCEKLNDHVWLIENAMQNTWMFEDPKEAVRRPQSITQELWAKLQDIIEQLTGPQKTLLCAFVMVNPIPEADLERQLKTLPIFQKEVEFEADLWNLRKKLLIDYNTRDKTYELNPFLRDVCFTYLMEQREMRLLETIPYFNNAQKPKYDLIQQAKEKGDFGTFFRLVSEKRNAGKYEEVVEILQDAFWNDARKEVILKEIGITYKWQKKWTKAKHFFEQALEVKPDDPKALTELAIIYKEQKDYDKAIELLKRATELGDIHSYNELAIIYKEQKDYDKAIETFNKALRINPHNPVTFNELAIVYREQKNYDRAIKVLREALNIHPNNVRTLNELAIIYKEQKNYSEAIQLLEKSLKIAPKDVKVLNELTIVYKEQKNYDKVVRGLKRTAELGNIDSYSELSIVYEEQKKYDKAIDVLNEALDINEEIVKALNQLSIAYKKQGNFLKALHTVQKNLESADEKVFRFVLSSVEQVFDNPNYQTEKNLHSTIEKALDYLQKANYSGYFEEMERVVPDNLRTIYNEQKAKFMSGNYPYNFYQQLETFANEVNKIIITLPIGGTVMIDEDGSIKIKPNEKEKTMKNSRRTILFVAANPNNEAHLQTDKEHRIIREEIQGGSHRDAFEFLPPQFAVTITGLLRAINAKPNIVHFSGHGDTSGIIITTEQNESQILPIPALQRLFRPLKDVTEVVVLNSCYSAEQAKPISEFGMYVVGNNLPIYDDAAISFAKGLYNGLSEGKSFEEALNDAFIVVIAEAPYSISVIEVWKDGNKLDI